jgi:4-amino-4-deoxy-L-arabinose transferase-like glycosyltransferase
VRERKIPGSASQRERACLWTVLILGLLMRLGYVLYTPIYMGQHDLLELGCGQGHIGYIEYFLEGGSIFHDFSPVTRYQFYHPPFSHLISAAFVRCSLLLGTPYETAFEQLQYLALFYSAVTLILFFRIFQELHFRGKALLTACLLTAFHPALYLLSGSINNDGLCLLFMTGAILYTLRWYRKQSAGNLFLIAVFVLGGIWTKLNAILITPAIGVVFFYVLVKKWKFPKERRRLLGQLAVFGIVVIPLGLTWSVYNYVKFQLPFDFTPAMLTTGSTQDVSEYSALRRLFGLRGGPLRQLAVQFAGDCKDYNIGITLLKTAVFGQYQLMSWGLEYKGLIVFTIVNGILSVLSLPAVCRLVGKKSRGSMEKWFFFLIYMINVLFYLKFCFQYTKVCSMDFRYIALTVLPAGAAFGWYQREQGETRTAKALLLLMLLWSILSIGCYLGLGLTPRAW